MEGITVNAITFGVRASRIEGSKWRLRPFDNRCKKFVAPDPDVEHSIRLRLPQWSGDFEELLPELTQQGVRFDDLPQLTIRVIAQYAIRAAQGGAMRAGPMSTALHTVVDVQSPGLLAAKDNQLALAAANLSDMQWRVLNFLVEHDIRNRSSAKPTKHISARVVKVDSNLVDLRRHFDSLKTLGFTDSQKGVGTWITPKGVDVVNGREAFRDRPARIVG